MFYCFGFCGFWVFSFVLFCLVVLGTNPRTSHMLGNPQPHIMILVLIVGSEEFWFHDTLYRNVLEMQNLKLNP